MEQNMIIVLSCYLQTQTVSRVYEIETDYVYEDFYEEFFDFTDYPEDLKKIPVNKKMIGKMKDEVKGKMISEFFGLKSKMYSLVIANDKEIKKAKGVSKNVVKKTYRHTEYVKVLFNKYFIRHNMKRIQSKLHKIGTYDVCKISLSCFHEKRHILNDGINSLVHLRKDIKS